MIQNERSIKSFSSVFILGIFKLLFRAFLSERRSAPRQNRTAEPEPPIDLTHFQRTTKIWVSSPPLEPKPQPQSPQTTSFVAGPCWVVDGDTIVINKITIRLAGIDAPEMDQPYGQKAKWALLGLCKGQVIRAVFDGSLSHDRSVATCYLPDGRDLSAEMVKMGMALDWPKFSGGKYRQFEQPGMRRILWRADARQKGRFPPTPRI